MVKIIVLITGFFISNTSFSQPIQIDSIITEISKRL
jgi:hypothetical protein